MGGQRKSMGRYRESDKVVPLRDSSIMYIMKDLFGILKNQDAGLLLHHGR